MAGRTTENKHGLTDMQVAFCHEYAKTFHATNSYIRAGYACKNKAVAKSAASRLLANVNIRAYLGEIGTLNPAAILNELVAVATSDISKLMSWDASGRTKVFASSTVSPSTLKAIKSIKSKPHFSPEGQDLEWEIEFTFYDKLSALEKLMKKFSLYPKEMSVIEAAKILGREGLLTEEQVKVIDNAITNISESIRAVTPQSVAIESKFSRELLAQSLGIPGDELPDEMAKG